jgi:hypothetical protein
LINNQLVDGREWLFDTEGPSLADISVYFMFAWISTMSKDWAGSAEYPHMLNVRRTWFLIAHQPCSRSLVVDVTHEFHSQIKKPSTARQANHGRRSCEIDFSITVRIS